MTHPHKWQQRIVNLCVSKVRERTPVSPTRTVAQEELGTNSIRHLLIPTQPLCPIKLSIAPRKAGHIQV
jgi:hypothetical protein